MDDEKPDTRHLVFKPKEIVLTDTPSRPGDGTAISAQLIHRQNLVAEERAEFRRKSGIPFPTPKADPVLAPAFKAKELTPVNSPVRPGDEAAINVPKILLQNHIAEKRSGWGRIRHWRKRKSRRTRDFIIFVGGLDLAIAFAMMEMHDFITLTYGIAAITLVTSVFGWVMFFVMEDY